MVKILAPIKQRIIEYLEMQGISKINFYEQFQVASSNFRGKGMESEVGGELIAKILTLYKNVNAEWLLTGKGDMLKTQIDNFSVSKSEPICDKCLEKEERIKELKEIIETQRKLINYLECERPDCESGQKRKAG